MTVLDVIKKFGRSRRSQTRSMPVVGWLRGLSLLLTVGRLVLCCIAKAIKRLHRVGYEAASVFDATAWTDDAN